MAIRKSPLTRYPVEWPLPNNGYQLTIDNGLVRTNLVGSNNQRRIRQNGYGLMQLTFAMPVELLQDFVSWANAYGYQWHYMPIKSQHTGMFSESDEGGSDDSIQLQTVRFASDLRIDHGGFDFLNVSISVELKGADIGSGSLGGIAGTLPPSTLPPLPPVAHDPDGDDWIIAQNPIVPSEGWIIAGTALKPSVGGDIVAGTVSNIASLSRL